MIKQLLPMLIPIGVLIVVMLIGRWHWRVRDYNNANRNPDGEPRP